MDDKQISMMRAWQVYENKQEAVEMRKPIQPQIYVKRR